MNNTEKILKVCSEIESSKRVDICIKNDMPFSMKINSTAPEITTYDRMQVMEVPHDKILSLTKALKLATKQLEIFAKDHQEEWKTIASKFILESIAAALTGDEND